MSTHLNVRTSPAASGDAREPRATIHVLNVAIAGRQKQILRLKQQEFTVEPSSGEMNHAVVVCRR